MANKTPLYQDHIDLGAKMVGFAGWDMPIHYGSQIDEHHHVRRNAGMFDVSHMAVVDVQGQHAKDFLRYMLANDVAKLQEQGKALYTCMLNGKGGVLDDLIVYFRGPEDYRLIVNAGTRKKDVAWLTQHANDFSVYVAEHHDLAMIAIQGPQARAKANTVLKRLFSAMHYQAIEALKAFQGIAVEGWWIARTGYTGEEGYEIILPENKAHEFWQALIAAGVKPCGLGARDTLRLEAGLNLYGNDMDEKTSPLIANLAWTVVFEPSDRDFIGRAALEAQKRRGTKQKLVGLILETKGVLRNHQKVKIESVGEGEVTSGSFSPTLNKAIAFARIPKCEANTCFVEIRNKWLPARIVKVPFVRKGEVVV